MTDDSFDPQVVLHCEPDDVRELLREHRRWADITVDAVADRTETLERLQTNRYDALIVEPAALGADAERSLSRVEEIDPNVPVILYTDLDPETLDDRIVSTVRTIVERGDPTESHTCLRDKVDAVTAESGAGRASAPAEYELLVEAARDGIYVLDANGRFRYVNRSMAEMVGHDREALVGTHASRVMAPGELERGQAVVR